MATNQDIDLDENTTPTVNITVTLDGGVFNGTNFALELYVKAGRATADASAKFAHKSTDVSPKIVWVSQVTGTATWTPAAADLTPPGQYWYRLDVYNSITGKRYTAARGNLNIKDS